MTYLTVKQHRKPIKISFEDALFGKIPEGFWNGESIHTGTVTRCVNEIPEEFTKNINVNKLINWLERFNSVNKDLHDADKETLYDHFKIPKSTGGWRPIDAPNAKLQNALRTLVQFLKEDCGLLYHTAAFAYIEDRCIVDAVKRHTNMKSNWFLKTDVSGFFPNTTLEFTMDMLSRIFPLSLVMENEKGKAELTKAISLGFLNGGLPQGTVLSPFLTNVIFIPIDHRLFGEFSRRKMVYTRYADDMYISAGEKFPYKEMVKLIKDAFREFNSPYQIKDEKTRFGNASYKNWILGLMCTNEHRITVGYRNKKWMKAALCNFILDTKNRKPWDLDEVRHLYGLLSYYRMVEKEYFDNLVKKYNSKWNVNVDKLFRAYDKVF